MKTMAESLDSGAFPVYLEKLPAAIDLKAEFFTGQPEYLALSVRPGAGGFPIHTEDPSFSGPVGWDAEGHNRANVPLLTVVWQGWVGWLDPDQFSFLEVTGQGAGDAGPGWVWA